MGADSRFVIEGSYLDRSYYAAELRRGGMEITFVGVHRPIEAYAGALTSAGAPHRASPRAPSSRGGDRP